jgi:hypothetical protein
VVGGEAGDVRWWHLERETAENGPLTDNIVERGHSNRSVCGVRRHEHTELLRSLRRPGMRCRGGVRGESHVAPDGGLVAVPELLSRFVPTIVTTVPAGPPHGVTNVMVGEQPPGFALANLVGLLAVSLALVTWIVPLASPVTVAQITFPDTTLNSDTGVPPMSTLVTIGSLKFVPVITTTHPAGPLVGENEEMVGEAADAGASRLRTTRADTTATAARRSPKCRLKRVMAPSSLYARDTRQSA